MTWAPTMGRQVFNVNTLRMMGLSLPYIVRKEKIEDEFGEEDETEVELQTEVEVVDKHKNKGEILSTMLE